jgi:hypothetical protein
VLGITEFPQWADLECGKNAEGPAGGSARGLPPRQAQPGAGNLAGRRRESDGILFSGITFRAPEGATLAGWLTLRAALLHGLLFLLFGAFAVPLAIGFMNTNRWRYNPERAVTESSTGMMADFREHCSSRGKGPTNPKVMLAKGALVKSYTAAARLYPDQGWYVSSGTRSPCWHCLNWAVALGNRIDRLLIPEEKEALDSLAIYIKRTELSSFRSASEHSALEIQFGADDDPSRKRWYCDNGWTGRYVGGVYDERTHLCKHYQREVSWDLNEFLRRRGGNAPLALAGCDLPQRDRHR